MHGIISECVGNGRQNNKYEASKVSCFSWRKLSHNV